MDSDISRAIIKTLIYHDLFDYPLTSQELWRLLVWEKEEPPDKSVFYKALFQKHGFSCKKGYYFISGRDDIILKRITRHNENKTKNFEARKTAFLLKLIPTIKFLGISGSLSMNNSRVNDDIDFFIITRKNTLWITRFFTTLLIFALRKKRGFGMKKNKDKICLNMFVSEDNLSFKKNLFIAHEIVQLKPLFNKDHIYEELFYKNIWLNNFLPNVSCNHPQKEKKQLKRFSEKLIAILDLVFFIPQYFYMRSKITREIIEKNRAEFHPRDTSFYVLLFYRARCSKKGYDLASPAVSIDSFSNDFN